MVRLGLVGGMGRMGARVVARMHRDSQAQLSVVLLSKERLKSMDAAKESEARFLNAHMTCDPAEFAAHCDVVVDFSAPAAAADLAPVLTKAHVAYLVASTALTAQDSAALDTAAQSIPVLQAANLSLGIGVLQGLVAQAVRSLGPAFDVEIVETHHRYKRDAPSGTALALGQAAKSARPELVDEGIRNQTRGEQSIGYAAVRGGDCPGEHTVYLLGEGERLELTHRSSSPDIFADGAIRSALWLAKQACGHHSMKDLLFGNVKQEAKG